MAASPAGAGPVASSLATFLPGPVPDRETWEGWTRWRLARGSFTAAPTVTAAEHADMTARQRRLHDLHRAATHSNLAIQETPMSAWVSKELRSLVGVNAFCHGPDTRPGLMVNGGACQGKTETVCEALACFEDDWLGLYAQAPGTIEGTIDDHVPVAYVRTPVKATPISACQRILDFYGEDYKGMPLAGLLRTVKQAVHDHGTKVLAVDDVTRLKLHREADQDVLDLIRELMSLPVTLVLIGVGIPKSGLLRDGRRDPVTGQWLFPPVKDRGKSRNDDAPGQTDLRFDLVDLDRFSYGGTDSTAAWIAHLVGLEQQLRLLNARDRMLSDGAMPEYLFRRTGGIVGIVGILRKLIQKACRHAIESGTEEITTGLLDSLTLTRRDLPGLDPDSGEIPDIPPHRPPESRASPASRGTPSSMTTAPPQPGPQADPAMPRPRPFPRSLAPLPGESLPGLILRLSYRLNQPPARIAELTGLAPDGRSGAHLPAILLAGVPEPARGTFTRATRITDGQAAQLGMASWQERYPPVIASPESTARGARRLNGQVVLRCSTVPGQASIRMFLQKGTGSSVE